MWRREYFGQFIDDDTTAQPRDERTEAAATAGGRLPSMDEQDWPRRPEWPGRNRWRTWNDPELA